MTTALSIRANAAAFCVWREARSVAWQATAEEIADAVGTVDASDVTRICASRGWPILSAEVEVMDDSNDDTGEYS